MLRRNNLNDPDVLTDADVVIYDGHCNFCRAQASRLQRLDLGRRRLAFLSLHDPRVGSRYPDLSHQQLMDQMYVIDPQGRRHAGADAVKYLSRRLPLLWIVAPILHLPGTARLWRWMYGQLARRRYKLSGKSCDNDACSVQIK